MAAQGLAPVSETEAFKSLLLPLSSCINFETLHQLARGFSKQYRFLAKESTEHFLATQVTALPTGDEKGTFLVIDLGGTNLRVELIQLLGNTADAPADAAAPISNGAVNASTNPSSTNAVPVEKIRRMNQKSWPIEDHLKMDKAEDLFAWIGDCMAEVIRDADESDSYTFSPDQEIPIGVTFSFPMTQTSMSEATLMPMGKGFAITSDLNLGKMLLAGYSRHCEQDGFVDQSAAEPRGKKRKLAKLPKIRIAAITNDTVATYVSSAYTVKTKPGSRTAMGLIVGTGCNATIPMWLADLHEEKQNFVTLLPGQKAESTEIVINTEWTIRGTDIPMRQLGITTEWDVTLEGRTETPGFQPFEYMTGGRYLGELVRVVLLDLLHKLGDGEQIPSALLKKDSISTAFLATVVTQTDTDYLCQQLEKRFPSASHESESFWTANKAELIRMITNAVQTRASALISAATVGLLDCVGEITLTESPASPNGRSAANGTHTDDAEGLEEMVVAWTGSLMSKYPGFRDVCQSWIDQLVANGSTDRASKRVALMEVTDGGVIGAAVLAGVALSQTA